MAWITRGECSGCRGPMGMHCVQCRGGMCIACVRDKPVVCPYCKHETKVVDTGTMWNSVVIVAGLERWVNEGYETDDCSEIIKPHAKAYDTAKSVLAAYWRIQTRHPCRSFALPIVTLDVIGKEMIIDFRNEERKNAVICCHCDKQGACVVSYRPKKLERSFHDPDEVAALLDELVQTELFAPSLSTF